MKILLVCTGNTCRSPMAEAAMRKRLLDQGRSDWEVSSAGTGAWEGNPASEGAYLVGLENGIDLSTHRARLVDAEMIEKADVILTMARHHRITIEELGGQGKTYLLGEFAGRPTSGAEVSDPFGADIDRYRSAYQEIEALVTEALDKLPT